MDVVVAVDSKLSDLWVAVCVELDPVAIVLITFAVGLLPSVVVVVVVVEDDEFVALCSAFRLPVAELNSPSLVAR